MIRKFIEWFFASTEKFDVAENVENSNCFYELSNSIDAVDARIDILTLENWNKKDV